VATGKKRRSPDTAGGGAADAKEEAGGAGREAAETAQYHCQGNRWRALSIRYLSRPWRFIRCHTTWMEKG
jgi:hypothetical protein